MISTVDLQTIKDTNLGQSLTPEILLGWQIRQVRKAANYMRQKSDFYAKKLAAFDLSKITSFKDMEQLPFTFSEDLRNSPASFVCVPARDVRRVTTFCTSGSTGVAKQISFTEKDLEKTVRFFQSGMRDFVQEKDSAMIMLSVDAPDSVANLLQRALADLAVNSHVTGQIKDMERIVETAAGADCIIGVPSDVINLCRRNRELRPKSVLLTADYVPECIIKNIEKIWQCTVFTHYGMTETGFGCAVQCRAKSAYHIRHSDMIVEIVDPLTGAQLPSGEKGEVVITTFCHEGTPLLRYRTGDVACMKSGTCACGGTFPRLGKIIGRLENIINAASCHKISIEELDELVYSFDGVFNYTAEIMRDDHGESVLSLIVDSDNKIGTESLIDFIRSHLGNDIKLHVRYERLFPSPRSEKRRLRKGMNQNCECVSL